MSNRPDFATSTSQNPRAFGTSRSARGPRQSWRVRIVGFSRGLPSAIRTGSKPRVDDTSLNHALYVGVHPGNDVGVLLGDVVQLERVVLHVVELERRDLGDAGRRLVAQELVRLRTRGEGSAELGLIAAVPLEKQRPIGPAGGLDSLEQREQALAVEAHAWRGRHAARVEQRGREIDMGGDAVDHAAGRQMPGPADVARDVDAAVVDRPFPAAQAGVEPHVRGAVVGEEDDDRVAGEPFARRGPSRPCRRWCRCW